MAITHWGAAGCGLSWETVTAVNAAAAQLLRPAMQLAAIGSSVTAAMPKATAEAAAASIAGQDRQQQQQQQQQPGLRLDTFSSHAVWAIGLLYVLSAHSLTCLKVNLDGSRQVPHAATALASSLSRLANLQRLQFQGNLEGGLEGCLPVVAQLSKLTRLELRSI
jgi:hypothetical protein